MLDEIKKCLDEAKTLAVFGHENIDGDALGAILGFGSLLEKQGKKVSYFTPNRQSHIFDFLNIGDKLRYEFDYKKYDVLVFLDFNQYSRISAFSLGYEDYFDSNKKIIIDHHKPEEVPTNSLIYRDPSSISTCSLLYEITKEWWKDLIDEDVATYFYMGLSTDSGNFRYDQGEQSVRSFRVAADLLELGARKKIIIDEVFRSKSYRSVQFMQLVLGRMQKMHISVPGEEYGVLKVIYSYYEDSELEQYDIDHDEADYGLNIMQDIRNNDLVIFVKKIDNFLKVSLRGRGNIDCSFLANLFGGGGHHNASGLKIQSCGYIEKDVQDFMSEVNRYFQEYSEKLLCGE